MAAALRFAARRICGRALQQPPQPYFSAVAQATIKEEQRLLLPRVSHGGSALRRFSAEDQNHLKNSEHGAVSAANPAGSSPLTNNAQTTPPPPLWSPRNKKFLPLAIGYFTFLCATMSAVLYWDTRPICLTAFFLNTSLSPFPFFLIPWL